MLTRDFPLVVDWSDPNETLRDSEAFLKLTFLLFGVYAWELFITSDFEWSLIVGDRKFRWPLYPLAFFFLSRYCMLLSFIGLIIASSDTSQINCRLLYMFNSWAGNMSILCATTSLLIRTIALWERRLAAVIPLGVLCFVHWVLLYRGVFIVHAQWDPAEHTCLVSSTNAGWLTVNLFYTMAFDLIILICTTIALMKHSKARTGLSRLLFKGGLVYFLVSFTTNSIPAILNVLDLNPVMNIIATVPAACISVIAACRAVIQLQEFSKSEVHVHTIGQSNLRISTVPRANPKPPRYTLTRPEIQITTEHIRMEELPASSGTTTPSSKVHDSPIVSSVNIQAEPFQHCPAAL